MNEAAYLKSTIQSLESCLALARAGLRSLQASPATADKHAVVANFSRVQVKAEMTRLGEAGIHTPDDEALGAALIARAFDLDPTVVTESVRNVAPSFDEADQCLIANTILLNRLLEAMRPEVAEDVRAVIEGRGNIYTRWVGEEETKR